MLKIISNRATYRGATCKFIIMCLRVLPLCIWEGGWDCIVHLLYRLLPHLYRQRARLHCGSNAGKPPSHDVPPPSS